MGLSGMHLQVSSFLFPVLFALMLLSCFTLHGPLALGLANFEAKGNITDQQALLGFKDKITSDKLMWNNTVHFCRWHGVTCGHRYQRVTKLELGSLMLTGSISPFIGNLSFLRVLDLKNNSLSHEIPIEIGGLRRLQILKLNNNSLGGEIPSNISSCSKLGVFNVGYNLLVGEIPSVLGHLSNLQTLGLHDNNFRGSIPDSFGNLSSLKVVFFDDNKLSGVIPEALGQLTNLEIFSIFGNGISGTVPPSMFNLSKIRVLEISKNQIQGTLPSDLGITMPHLEFFSVSDNQLTGPLPHSISNTSNLTCFQAALNKFTGNLPSFQKLDKLEYFAIGNNPLGSRRANDLNFLCTLTNSTGLRVIEIGKNKFGGVLPECISDLSTNLVLFLVEMNDITGRIPDGIGNLTNLEMLYLYHNSLSGSIPSAIERLQKLKELNLLGNSLSGVIPPSLGNLKMLNELTLGQNNLQGSIPSSLGKCESLILLDLSNNNLSGSIPPEVVGLSSLSVYLELSSNQLTGVLPTQVGNLQNLGELYVANNSLSGVLPSSLGSCVRLEILDMNGNFFHGPIPSSFSSLKGLAVLNISHNILSGGIPEFLMQFKSLQYLNLSFNDFEGAVPIGGVFNNASATLVEGNNKLCGGIPEFHLPRCNFKRSTRRSSRMYKLIIPIISGLLGITLIFSFILIIRFRKKRRQPTSTQVENSLLKLSYQSILKATDGFSSANLVGVGSFGSVYKGVLEENGIVIAAKVLNLLKRGASRSFMAECETLRNIRHRNLVKVITACSSVDYHGKDFKALVYEFMVNGSLEDWLHTSIDLHEVEKPTKTLNFYQRLSVAVDVACAMDYLHHHCETPIVHCDLKPSNILLDDEMTGHVSDFGLAKFISANMQDYCRSQSSTRGLGTVGYAPPEYGLGSDVSTYGDVYSYGIVLLEMFTGKRPTDEMFKDSLNLHNFVKEALPTERLVEIIDPILRQERAMGETTGNFSSKEGMQRENILLHCSNSIFEIGVSCSAELPTKRMNMTDVAAELRFIRNKLFTSPTQFRN